MIVLVLFASYRFVRDQSAVNAAIVGATVGSPRVAAEAILLAVVLLVPLIVFFAARR